MRARVVARQPENASARRPFQIRQNRKRKPRRGLPGGVVVKMFAANQPLLLSGWNVAAGAGRGAETLTSGALMVLIGAAAGAAAAAGIVAGLL